MSNNTNQTVDTTQIENITTTENQIVVLQFTLINKFKN